MNDTVQQEPGPAPDHKHCVTCVTRACKVKPDNLTCCPLVSCPRGCPSRYHGCKEGEHSMLCAEERTECINKGYGCPLFLPRKKLLQHLAICPASVLYCSAEWNRSHLEPVKPKEEQPAFLMKKTYTDCGQLDTALAMRDHRVLVDMLQAPPQTRRILQNPLTQVYPAAPFARASSSAFTDDDGGENCAPPGEDQESIKRGNVQRELRDKKAQLCGSSHLLMSAVSPAPSCSSDCMDVHDADSSGPMDIGQNNMSDPMDVSKADTSDGRDVRKSDIADRTDDSQANTSVHTDVGQTNSSISSPVVDSGSTQESRRSSSGEVILHDKQQSVIRDGQALRGVVSVSLTLECIAKYQAKSSNMYTFLCAQEVRRDEYSNHFHAVHNRVHPDLNGWLEQRCPLAYLGCPFSFQRLKPSARGVNLCHSWLQESFGVTCVDPEVDPGRRTPAHLLPAGPETAQCPGELNGQTSVSFPTFGTLPALPRSSHTLPVIPHISHPLPPPSSSSSQSEHRKQVIYTGVHGNSCVRVDSTTGASYHPGHTPQTVHLDDLPLEVLRLVTKFLDSFSLCNLALVSRTMRDVCCSMLQDKGVVSLVWEKCPQEGRGSWQVKGKRWSFSSCFEAVNGWSFSGHNPISSHLLTCPYNQDRVQHPRKFSLVPLTDASLKVQIRDMLQERMQFLRCFGGPRWYIAAMKTYIKRLCETRYPPDV